MPGGDAMFIVSRFGRIEEVDDGACMLLGYSRAELLALHGSDLVLEHDRPRVAVSVDSMQRGALTDRSGHLRRKDGGIVEVDVRGEPLEDGRLLLRVSPRV